MLREIGLDVLTRDVVRGEGTVGESGVGEGHGDVWDVGSVTVLVSALRIWAGKSYVRELYIGVWEYRSCLLGGVV